LNRERAFEGAGSVTLLENTNMAGFVSAPRTFARA